MVDVVWIFAVAAGSVCVGSGMMAYAKSPKAVQTRMFFLAMILMMVAMVSQRVFLSIPESNSAYANLSAKVFVTSTILALLMLLDLSFLFPIEHKLELFPPNRHGAILWVLVAVSILAGSFAEITYNVPPSSQFRVTMTLGTYRVIVSFAITFITATIFSLLSRMKVSGAERRSTTIFAIGIVALLVGGLPYVFKVSVAPSIQTQDANIALVSGIAASGVLFFTSIAGGLMIMARPVAERASSGAKAKYRLLHKRVYLVEEAKPAFSFGLFADILKGRCFDCEDDESFTCESLDCSACGLPCPCKDCKKYTSRNQGLVVTRQFPKDIRSKYFLQTTPILWLSTVAGKDNMDPAKLSLLTDQLVNFMEKSQNGVILVDGIEYLITSNDFQRVLKSIDRWTDSAMTSSSRLIISVDPKAYDEKDIALIERNREVVRPGAAEPWKIIPEPI